MKQQLIIRNILAILGLTLVLSGCVTREYVTGTDNIDTERVIDTENAAMARLKLAIEYLRQNQPAAAKQNLDRAAALNDSIDGIQSSYAYYYQKVGEDVKANKAYQRAVNQFPDNSNIRNNYGAFLCGLKRYSQAQQQFIAAINTESNSQVAQTHENAALCALRAKNWAAAQTHFTVVLKYEPYRARAMLGLAKAEIHLNKPDQAKQALTKYRKMYALTPESIWLNILLEHSQNNQAMVTTLGYLLVAKFPTSTASADYLAKNFDE